MMRVLQMRAIPFVVYVVGVLLALGGVPST